MGIRFLAITQPYFGQYWSWALITIFDILALLWPKIGRGPTDTHMGLGHQNSTKKLTQLVDLLGHQA